MSKQKQNWLSRKFELSWRKLAPFVFAYILLPIVLFLLFWIRPYFGIPLAIFTAVSGLLASNPSFLSNLPILEHLSKGKEFLLSDPLETNNDSDDKKDPIFLSKKVLIILAVVALVWCILGGQGGLWSQTTDWVARNAVLHDLIKFSWPVYYDNGSTTLVYYINHWLPVAAPVHALFVITANESLCWVVGNILLLFWSAAGILIVELLVIRLLRAITTRQIAFVICLLIFFSGMDIAGLIARFIIGNPEPIQAVADSNSFLFLHLEWWATPGAYQFSSNTTLLFWVFNQSIIPWICVCALLLQRNYSSYLLILVACFSAGPYAGIGLSLIAVVLFVYGVIKMRMKKNIRMLVASTLSPINLIALFVGFIYATFYLNNQSVASTGERLQLFGLVPGTSIFLVIAFLFFEAGILLLLLNKEYRKTPVYWVITTTLLIIPFIHFGSIYEVCCRVSIPALFCLMLMCGKSILASQITMMEGLKKKNLASWALVVCLLLGAITPACEMIRSAIQLSDNGVALKETAIEGFSESQVNEGAANNFKAKVDTDGIFFKYFADK